MSRFTIETLSDGTEIFVGESFCAGFRNIPVAKKFLDKRAGGEYQDFTTKIFCLPVPKIPVKESFTVSLSSSIEKC